MIETPAPEHLRCRCVQEQEGDDEPVRCASRATQEDALCDVCRKGCHMARKVRAYNSDEVVVADSGWVHVRWADGDIED